MTRIEPHKSTRNNLLTLSFICSISLMTLNSSIAYGADVKPVEHPRSSSSPVHEAVVDDGLQWGMTIANAINKYFSQPYKEERKDSSLYSLKCLDEPVVYRPNHSLAHGLRQGYLAVDIVLLLKQMGASKSKGAEELINWINDKLKNDPTFLGKIEFASAFQRTGRESESTDSEKSIRYLNADLDNFEKESKDYIGSDKIFKDEEEFNLYKKALNIQSINKFRMAMKETKEDIDSRDLLFLSQIFQVAHILDLRRLPHFTKSRILEDISERFFGTKNPNEQEKQCIENLWACSGDYLSATGDRDMDDPQKQDFNREVFCTQAHKPELLVQALEEAKTKAAKTRKERKAEEQLLQSIVTHAQAMRQIKKGLDDTEEETPYTHTEAEKQEAKVLRKTLENAPYTASEAYLKILLAEKYQEIPQKATTEEARVIVTQNVVNFLALRIYHPDQRYIDILVECIMKERENRGKIVLYHATEPEMGFLYDVYTQLRNQLAISGGDDMRALRALDIGFLKLDEETQKEQAGKRAQGKANVSNFMNKFKGIDDNNPEYQDMGLSTNFSLFGSDQRQDSDTYNLFYLVKEKPIGLWAPKYENFFNYIKQRTGIPGEYSDYKSIMKRFACEGEVCRNGRLIQIFIDPEVLSDTVYFSVRFGTPVSKNGAPQSFKESISVLRTNPDNFMINYLKGMKGRPDDKTSQYLDLELHDLQARLFMRPEIMFNHKFVTVKSYWRLADPTKDYFPAITKLVNKNLAAWLQKGAPNHPNAFAPETVKLKKLAKIAYEGSTGRSAPESPPTPLETQFVELLVDKKNDEALQMLDEHLKELADKTFTTPTTRDNPEGQKVDLRGLISRYPDPQIIKWAFNKGIFPGGDGAYNVFSLLQKDIHKKNELYKDYETFEFLDSLLKAQNPAETSRLYLKYFGDHSEFNQRTFNAINGINNDESVITLSEPLRELFRQHRQYYVYDQDSILYSLIKVPVDERKDTVDRLMLLFSYFNDPKTLEGEIRNVSSNLGIIIEYIYLMKKLKFSDEKISENFSGARKANHTWRYYIGNVRKLEAEEEKKRPGIQ